MAKRIPHNQARQNPTTTFQNIIPKTVKKIRRMDVSISINNKSSHKYGQHDKNLPTSERILIRNTLYYKLSTM